MRRLPCRGRTRAAARARVRERDLSIELTFFNINWVSRARGSFTYLPGVLFCPDTSGPISLRERQTEATGNEAEKGELVDCPRPAHFNSFT